MIFFALSSSSYPPLDPQHSLSHLQWPVPPQEQYRAALAESCFKKSSSSCKKCISVETAPCPRKNTWLSCSTSARHKNAAHALNICPVPQVNTPYFPKKSRTSLTKSLLGILNKKTYCAIELLLPPTHGTSLITKPDKLQFPHRVPLGYC